MNPGAVNPTKPGARSVYEDADLRCELIADPTNFQAVLLVITNKTLEQISVHWNQISMIGPDRIAMPMHPDEGLGEIEPGTKLSAHLVPFVLPTMGGAAMAYDNQMYELVVPLRTKIAAPRRELRFQLKAHANRL
jgi:hypothetical protein